MVGLAQLAEHLVVVQGVAGSIPVSHPEEWLNTLKRRPHRFTGAAFVLKNDDR